MVNSMPTPRWRAQVFSINGSVFVTGGNSTVNSRAVERYFPNADSWGGFPDSHHTQYGAAIGVVFGSMYAAGGSINGSPNASNDMWRFTPFNGSPNPWTPVADMPVARNGAVGAVLDDNHFYVAGGISGGNVTPVHVYSPATNLWNFAGTMPIGVSLAGSAVVNNRWYISGGFPGNVSPSNPGNGSPGNWTQIFEPGVGWKLGPAMPTPRYDLAVTAVGKVIYAIGGRDGGGTLDMVEAFDTSTSQWQKVESLPRPRSALGAVTVNGLVYAIGGRTESLFESDLNERFTPGNITPGPTVDAGPDQTVTSNLLAYADVSLNASSATAVSYEWTSGDALVVLDRR